MSQNLMRPLNAGNVVTTALVLYRSHLKLYISLAFQALLWWLIPVYGWAKALTINAQISRLAFRELINQPETAKTALSHIEPRMWKFLGTGFLTGLILTGTNLCISFASTLILFIPILIISATFRNNPEIAGVITVLLQLIMNLVNLVVQLWFQGRLLITELPLAIESEVDAITTINRTWDLSKGSALRIQLILLVCYLITLPIFALAIIPIFFSIPALATTPRETAITTFLGFFLLTLIIMSIFGTILAPFWQAVKAVIYYDLRNRREGIGLKLRDSQNKK